MRILIVTDAWFPQTNGVVHTLSQTAAWLGRFGHEVRLITPQDFRTFPCPTYPEIRISVFPYQQVEKTIAQFQPHAIHIATEGTLGLAARRVCVRRKLKFTTSYHTQFPQYLKERYPIPLWASYAALTWFHNAAERCMVSTKTVHGQLATRGFKKLARWQRGVDTELFRPYDKSFLDLPRPIAVCVGRVAVEKNVDAFLRMPWHGSKLVVGDGPELPRLKQQYPNAVYAGFKFGEELARHVAASDILVFPSLTDTFGLVNLEAMACGVPVAAFPVTGPIDVVEDGVDGALDHDLAKAAVRALSLSPEACRKRALQSGWDACTRQFEANLASNEAHVVVEAERSSVLSTSQKKAPLARGS